MLLDDSWQDLGKAPEYVKPRKGGPSLLGKQMETCPSLADASPAARRLNTKHDRLKVNPSNQSVKTTTTAVAPSEQKRERKSGNLPRKK